MTTFTTVEELMQVLDANPHLLEGLRSRLLTRELLELPETVARLTERIDQLTERMDQLTERMDQLTERMDQLTERVDQIAEQLAQLAARFDQFTERVDRRFDQVANDFTWIKGRAAMDATREQSHAIAVMLGLRRQLHVHGNEIIDLARHQNTTDISPGDLSSFSRADLIMEATDAAGELHYVAIEVSFTADARDTRRAIRNAGYLTRFTGRPAHAVVAGFRKDRDVQLATESGQALWFQLDDDEAN